MGEKNIIRYVPAVQIRYYNATELIANTREYRSFSAEGRACLPWALRWDWIVAPNSRVRSVLQKYLLQHSVCRRFLYYLLRTQALLRWSKIFYGEFSDFRRADDFLPKLLALSRRGRQDECAHAEIRFHWRIRIALRANRLTSAACRLLSPATRAARSRPCRASGISAESA